MTQEVKILIGIGVITLGVLIGAVFFLSSASPEAQVTPEDAKANQEILIRENSQRIGSDSAKIVLVEFADFQCPACGAAHPTVKQVLSEYPEDVLFVYRNFPLPMHKNAKLAAYAAEAAGKQGMFWDMHSLLFENQADWSESNEPMTIFTDYANLLGLDSDQFAQDVKSEEIAEKITDDMADGAMLGVNSTPTFFLNGVQAFQGVPSYETLKQAIENELGK